MNFFDTGVGKFLSKAAPDILSVVGNVPFVAPVISVVRGLIDSHQGMNEAQKLNAKDELMNDGLDLIKEYNRSGEENERQLTERQKNDLGSDSWLAKNIRPLMLSFLTFSITLIAVLDSLHYRFMMVDSWKGVFQSAWLSVLGFYFVGRSVEKVVQIKK